MPSEPPSGSIVVTDADPATRGLIVEWLSAEGWSVIEEDGGEAAVLAIVDVPHPRGDGGGDAVRRVRARHPDAPILAISSAFMPSVQRCGACARLLGVQGTLAKPLERDAIVHAVRELLRGGP